VFNRSKTEDLSKKIEDISESVKKIGKKVDNILRKISDLEDKNRELENSMKQIPKYGDIKKIIGDLDSKFEGFKRSISTILDSNIQRSSEMWSQIRNSLDSLQNLFQEKLKEILTEMSNYEILAQNLQKINQRVDSILIAYKDFKNKLSTLGDIEVLIKEMDNRLGSQIRQLIRKEEFFETVEQGLKDPIITLLRDLQNASSNINEKLASLITSLKELVDVKRELENARTELVSSKQTIDTLAKKLSDDIKEGLKNLNLEVTKISDLVRFVTARSGLEEIIHKDESKLKE